MTLNAVSGSERFGWMVKRPSADSVSTAAARMDLFRLNSVNLWRIVSNSMYAKEDAKTSSFVYSDLILTLTRL